MAEQWTVAKCGEVAKCRVRRRSSVGIAALARVRVNSWIVVWMGRLYFVRDAAEAYGGGTSVAECVRWVIATDLAPGRVTIGWRQVWCVERCLSATLFVWWRCDVRRSRRI